MNNSIIQLTLAYLLNLILINQQFKYLRQCFIWYIVLYWNMIEWLYYVIILIITNTDYMYYLND